MRPDLSWWRLEAPRLTVVNRTLRAEKRALICDLAKEQEIMARLTARIVELSVPDVIVDEPADDDVIIVRQMSSFMWVASSTEETRHAQRAAREVRFPSLLA